MLGQWIIRRRSNHSTMRGETGGDQYAGNVLAADETFKQQHNEGVQPVCVLLIIRQKLIRAAMAHCEAETRT